MWQTVLHTVQHNTTDRTTCCPLECDRSYHVLSNIMWQTVLHTVPHNATDRTTCCPTQRSRSYRFSYRTFLCYNSHLSIPPSLYWVNATEFHSRCLESCSQCSFIVQGEVLLKSAFLGLFTKLRKATISFVLSVSVCLSVCSSFRLSVRPSTWNNSASTGRIFVKFDIWILFENTSKTFKFH
jgi:hypothetical protein